MHLITRHNRVHQGRQRCTQTISQGFVTFDTGGTNGTQCAHYVLAHALYGVVVSDDRAQLLELLNNFRRHLLVRFHVLQKVLSLIVQRVQVILLDALHPLHDVMTLQLHRLHQALLAFND
ncbi:hypothetical protein D3C77_580510 [compost metagenome]